MRKELMQATSYKEWRALAASLDRKENRDVWQRQLGDETGSRSHNWGLISELVSDMRKARATEDEILALAVLQQCLRRNVGGILDEDLFSRTHTGEPKRLVTEFVQETVETLDFVTEKAGVVKSVMTPSLKMLGGAIEEERGSDGDGTEKLNKSLKAYRTCLANSFAVEENKIFNVKCHAEVLEGADNAGHSHFTTVAEARKRASTIIAFDDTINLEDIGLSDDDEEEVMRNSSVVVPPSHKEYVLKVLKKARQTYGRTALCLSGGAANGFFHFGHIKALREVDLLPSIISGASAGTLVSAFVCTRTDEELDRDLDPEILSPKLTHWDSTWKERISMYLSKGHMFDEKIALEKTYWFANGNLTFEEAYKKTGRVLCISISPVALNSPPVLLNYISAPNVVIASAVVASSSIPPALPSACLMVKDENGKITTQGEYFNDGSIKQDIPKARLSELLNCQFFITAQVNPNIVPFMFNNKGGVGKPTRYDGHSEESLWRGGALLSSLELYLRLGIFAKFKFLGHMGAAMGSLSQDTYTGSTTIVPRVTLDDYRKLVHNPSPDDLRKKIQSGLVAAYRHCSLIEQNHVIARALDDCIERLEVATSSSTSTAKKPRKTYSM